MVAPSRCTGCGEGVGPTHLVYRVVPPNHAPQLYHYECHQCYICGHSLTSGDAMAVGEMGIECAHHRQTSPTDYLPETVPTEPPAPAAAPAVDPNVNIAFKSLESMSSAVANIEATVGRPVTITRTKRQASDSGARRRSGRRQQASTSNLEPQMCLDTHSGRTYLESPPPEAYYFSR